MILLLSSVVKKYCQRRRNLLFQHLGQIRGHQIRQRWVDCMQHVLRKLAAFDLSKMVKIIVQHENIEVFRLYYINMHKFTDEARYLR